MEVQKKVFDFISSELVKDTTMDFDPSMNLIDSGLDSVAMMELIVWIEDTFNIAIDAEHLTPDNFGTLDAIAAYVEGASASG